MIKLTKPNGIALYLAPELITSVTFVYSSETAVWSTDRESRVTESPEEVVRKIMEYKIGIIDYKVLYDHNEAVSVAEKHLYRLAGLEDTPDA